MLRAIAREIFRWVVVAIVLSYLWFLLVLAYAFQD
jgi:hypothetical protein